MSRRRKANSASSSVESISQEDQFQWLLAHAREHLASGVSVKAKSGLTAWQQAALAAQAKFRWRSRQRFPDPSKWLWTERSLSQSSDWWTASLKADMFPKAVEVIDCCCGAGVDAVAIASRGPVQVVDSDASMVQLAINNAASHGYELEGKNQPFENCDFSSNQWLHVDPDRRPGERRTNLADAFSPTLEEVFSVADKVRGAMIKLAPSTKMNPEMEQRLEDTTTRCWIGNRGECRQQLILTGELRREKGYRFAYLAEPPSNNPAEDSRSELEAGGMCFSAFSELSPPDDYLSAEYGTSFDAAISDSVDDYVYDLHAVLHASALQVAWATTQGLQALTAPHGFFTGGLIHARPWAAGFRVLDVLPWDDRRVRKALRSIDAGIVEIKVRLAKAETSQLQRRYSGAGSRPITILVTKIADRTRAILAERLVQNGST